MNIKQCFEHFAKSKVICCHFSKMGFEDSFRKSVLSILIFSCFVTFLSLFISLSYISPKPSKVPEIKIPPKFAIDYTYDVPPKLAEDLPAYVYGISSYFESYYNKLGLSLRKLLKNEYVAFNDTIIYDKILAYCAKPASIYVPLCLDIVNQKSVSVVKVMNMIYYENSFFSDMLMPVNQSTNVTVNIEFEMKSPSFGYTVHEIKELMAESKHPLLLSFPNINARYYIPCTEKYVSKTEECTKQKTPCPNFYNQQFCASTTTGTFLNNGEFYVPKQPAVPFITSDLHNFVVEGYNDDDTIFRGLYNFNSMRESLGGFIVRGLHSGYSGKPIVVRLGTIEPSSVADICQNEFAPSKWVPANITSANSTYFSTLACIDKTGQICDPIHQYALVQSGSSLLHDAAVSEDLYGFTRTVLIDINNGSIITVTPHFWTLSDYFVPFYDPVNEPSCGHYMVSYDYLNIGLALGSDSLHAGRFPIKFPSSSYTNVKPQKFPLKFKRSKN